MRNQKVTRILHRSSGLSELYALLQTEYLSTDGKAPRRQIICERAPYADRIVEPEAILDIMVLVEKLIQREEQHLGRFELRERDEDDLELPETITGKEEKKNDGAEAPAAGIPKAKRSIKRGKPGGGSPGTPEPAGGGSTAT